jgi:predicted CopG family antitoxin
MVGVCIIDGGFLEGHSIKDVGGFNTGKTSTILCIQYIRMSTSIRISEETKQKLEAVKRDDETFDELLDRLAVTRTPDDVEAMAGFGEGGIEKHMKKTHDELSKSLEENSRR